MRTADEYREMAEECFEWAKTALSEEVRLTYLNIAQIWQRVPPYRVASVPN
jgi:hypothetical protein